MSLPWGGLRAFSQTEPQKAGIGDRIVAGPWDLRLFRRRKSFMFHERNRMYFELAVLPPPKKIVHLITTMSLSNWDSTMYGELDE